MSNPITGIIHITGEPDTGKTTFALTTGANPREIVFFDDDLKTQAIADALADQGTPFGAYYNLTKLSLGMREIDFHNLVIGLIDGLSKNTYKVLVFDTWSRFEATMQPVVAKNPTRFRETYSTMGAIKGAEQWKASFDYETTIFDKMLQIAPLVIIVSHLKDQSIGAVKTGAQIPDVKKPIIEKSRMRIWLRHNPAGAAPIGLVLKRLSKITLNGGGLRAVNVLPRKLNPCTWDKLLDYWSNPLDERAPNADEQPNDFELSILDGALTADQKDALHINRMEVDKPQVAEPPTPPAPAASRLPTLSDLVDRYGPEKVMDANLGSIPGTDSDVAKVAEVLGWS